MTPNSKTESEQIATINTLVQLLSDCEEGSVVTYDIMKRETNLVIQEHRHLFYMARDRVLKETGARFQNEIGVGYKKLLPTMWAGAVVGDVRTVKRAARRGRKRLRPLDLSRTPDQDRLLITASSAVLSVIEQSAGKVIRGHKPILSTVYPTVGPPSTFITRRPFRKNGDPIT